MKFPIQVIETLAERLHETTRSMAPTLPAYADLSETIRDGYREVAVSHLEAVAPGLLAEVTLELERARTELDQANAVADSMQHFADVADRLERKVNDVYVPERDAALARLASVRPALLALAEGRRDYVPGLTGAQMPDVDLIAFEISTVEWVLRMLEGGDVRGWFHSSRWSSLPDVAVLPHGGRLRGCLRSALAGVHVDVIPGSLGATVTDPTDLHGRPRSGEECGDQKDHCDGLAGVGSVST